MNEKMKLKIKLKLEMEKCERLRLAREKLLDGRVVKSDVEPLRIARIAEMKKMMRAMEDAIVVRLASTPDEMIEDAVTEECKRICNEGPKGSGAI